MSRSQIDEKLSWECHIDMISKKASAGTGAMKLINAFVPIDNWKRLKGARYRPTLNIASPYLWDNYDKLLKDKLQRFQSWAARVVSWNTLDERRLGAKSILMYKIQNYHIAPSLLLEAIVVRLVTICVIVQQIWHFLNRGESLYKKGLSITTRCFGTNGQMKRN